VAEHEHALRVDAVEPWGQVSLSGSAGTSADGAAFQVVCIALAVWDETGLTRLIGIYEPEDADVAVARLASLGPSDRPA